MLAVNSEGHGLVRILQVREEELLELGALTHSLVAAHHAERSQLVFDRAKKSWQLPGGAIEPGESARQCAVRELREETANECAPEALRFVCAFELAIAPTRFNPEAHVEFGALYELSVKLPASFIPSEEIEATLWWDGSTLSHDFNAIHRALLGLLFADSEPTYAAADAPAHLPHADRIDRPGE